LTHVLLGHVLFNLHEFWDFLVIFLLLISNLIPLGLEYILCMTSVILNVLRLVLWPTVLFVLLSITCILEKNVYFVVVGWSL